MSVILAFLALVALAAGWWLSQQRLMSKPWLETGLAPAGTAVSATAPGKVGLTIFVVVIGGLFAMLGSAFVMQIDETPWELVPLPRVILFNTALLACSSVFMALAASAARVGAGLRMHANLAAASVSALVFLLGQVQAWVGLTNGGYPLNGPPAAGFFYLITGLHGLHILGGLVALGAVWIGSATGRAPQRLWPSITLCGRYWHALLAIWLVLFALLQGWGNEFLALCRTAIT